MVVGFTNTELAEPEEDRLADIPVSRGKVLPEASCDIVFKLFIGWLANRWRAKLRRQLLILTLSDLFQARLRNIGKRGVGRSNIVLAHHVAHTHANMLRILEAVQDRVD